MHPNALPAAKAAAAAQRQGKFWEMHDLIFENHRALSDAKYREFAEQLGLDVAQFEKDMASTEVKQQIDRELAEGRAAGVRGTPTFFVNGRRVTNRSVEGFKALIDATLADAAKQRG